MLFSWTERFKSEKHHVFTEEIAFSSKYYDKVLWYNCKLLCFNIILK